MLEKEIVKKIGEKYKLTEKQSMEMYNQFIEEYLMFNLYDINWQFLNYPGLGVFSVNLSPVIARQIKTQQALDKEEDVRVKKRLENQLNKYKKLRGFITEYNTKHKHKRMKG